MAPQLRLDVPHAELLTQLVARPLPLGLKAAPPIRSLHRDVYFDTADGELKRRGLTCRIRFSADDRRYVAVHFAGSGGGRTVEARVSEADQAAIFGGRSEPARRLRAITDPARLVPRIELTVDRQMRRGRSRLFPLPQFSFAYDAIATRRGDTSATFHELLIRQLWRARVSLTDVAQAFEDEHGLHTLLTSRPDRAELVLESLESRALAQAVQVDRELTVIAIDHGRAALMRGAEDLRLPFRRGSGEAACRELMRACLGSSEGQLTLLGTVPAAGTRPTLEVWAALRRQRSSPGQGGQGLEWFTASEIVARAGSPILRDPKTLAALAVATHSDVLRDWAPHPSQADDEATLEAVDAQSRRTLTALRIPSLREDALDASRPAPEQFLNPYLSWVEFNARVLALAEDPGTPLLARLRFLAIFSSNLDEFFQIQVASLKQAVAAGVSKPGPDGLTPQEQLSAIALRLRPLLDRQYHCFRALAEHDLPARGIRIRRWGELDREQQTYLGRFFDEQVFPLLTPRAITLAPGHPFPFIEDLRLSLAVIIREAKDGRRHFAHLKVPRTLPRFVRLPETEDFVPLEDVVQTHAGRLYPTWPVEDVHPFRLTRAGDLELDEHATADFLQAVEEEVQRRPFAPVVRIEIERSTPPAVRELLERELRFEEAPHPAALGDPEVYATEGIVDLGGLFEIAALAAERPGLDYPPFTPAAPLPAARPVFDVLDERDVLVHHPYDAFEATFERFLIEAADDPDVVAIKLTLYRPGGRTEIGDALERAAAAGKDVSVFVELRARFDEQRNIVWARQLERAGIHVVTGLVRFKTHAKIALVVRQRDGAVRRYAHIGTGNYNRSSARLYTDFGLFTADEAIGADLHALFNGLTGAAGPPEAEFCRLLVAPTNMRARFLELIERETDHARAGRGGRIRAKMNSLTDAEVIGALYTASQADVNIELIVRGMCTLRPGIPGLSERIRVVSLLGRFLEHGRIYYFANAGDPEWYIGSADWRPRNLRRRVEVATPVYDKGARARLDEILELELDDPFAWELLPDGSYVRVTPPTGVELTSAQERFIECAAGGGPPEPESGL